MLISPLPFVILMNDCSQAI